MMVKYEKFLITVLPIHSFDIEAESIGARAGFGGVIYVADSPDSQGLRVLAQVKDSSKPSGLFSTPEDALKAVIAQINSSSPRPMARTSTPDFQFFTP